mgnify:CR=1 FL=1
MPRAGCPRPGSPRRGPPSAGRTARGTPTPSRAPGGGDFSKALAAYKSKDFGGAVSAQITGFPTKTSFVEGTLKDVRDSTSMQGSCVRIPNGQDSNDQSVDWSFSSMANPSPGASNK